MSRHFVAILAYEGLRTFEFGCAIELFALARPELGVDWYDYGVCASERHDMHAAGGILVTVPHTLRLLERANTIVIPGWRDARERPPEALMKQLRKAHARGARLCSICSGAFVLAATGLLEGKRATVHWRQAKLLASMYPGIRVDVDSLYVDEGQIITSAGSAAGIDMLVYLVRRDYGHKIANQVARRLIMAPHRQGGQSQYIERPVSIAEPGRIVMLLDWVRSNLDRPLSLSEMASRAAMSKRTLQREFKATTGESAHAWVLRERLDAAKALLEQPPIPLEHIAARCGFRSMETFRYQFRKVLGTTPSAYRGQLASPRSSRR